MSPPFSCFFGLDCEASRRKRRPELRAYRERVGSDSGSLDLGHRVHRSGGGEQRDDSHSGSCRRRSFGRNLVGHRHNVPGRIDKACYSVSVVPPLVFDSSERLTIFCFWLRTQGPHRFAPAIRHHDWYLSAVFRAVWFFLHQREHPHRLGIIVEEDISNRTHLSEIQGGASFRLPWALQVIPGLVLGTLMWIFPGEFRSPEERRKT